MADWQKAQQKAEQQGLNRGDPGAVQDFVNQKKVGPQGVQKLKSQGVGGDALTPAATKLPQLPKLPKQTVGRRASDEVWSKSPSTVRDEFGARVGAGHHPDSVFKQIISEIADHYAAGKINDRDAHRSANEALGRYMLAKKRRADLRNDLMQAEGDEIKTIGEYDDYADDAMREGDPDAAAAMREVISDEEDHARVFQDQIKHLGRRKQAWMGWGPAVSPKRHKVAGWEWDNHLNGFISNKPRRFECACGEPVQVPDYHHCKCGKIWNTYVIGTGGDRHQAAAEKFIAREIPVRDNVIVANRRHLRGANDEDYDDVEDNNPFPSDHIPKTDTRSKGVSNGRTSPDWHSRDHKTQRYPRAELVPVLGMQED